MPAILVSQNAQTARKPLKFGTAIIVGMAHSYSIHYTQPRYEPSCDFTQNCLRPYTQTRRSWPRLRFWLHKMYSPPKNR